MHRALQICLHADALFSTTETPVTSVFSLYPVMEGSEGRYIGRGDRHGTAAPECEQGVFSVWPHEKYHIESIEVKTSDNKKTHWQFHIEYIEVKSADNEKTHWECHTEYQKVNNADKTKAALVTSLSA